MKSKNWKIKSFLLFVAVFSLFPTTFISAVNSNLAGSIDFTNAAEKTVNAVVHVKTKSPVQGVSMGMGIPNDPFFEYFFGRPDNRQQQQQQQPQMQEASGSGVIISNDGYIVTNNHVVENSKEIQVVLNDKRTYTGKVVGADPSTDIALIKIEADGLSTIQFGNSDSLKIGEWVLAVGNPFNLTSTVTAGIVSAKARNINILSSAMKIESFIQTDAVVNPGNSGGALVNSKGELIGINTAIFSQTGSYAGYAFAVPSSIVEKVVADIRKYGNVQRAVLGVEIRDIDNQLAKDKKLKTLDGAYVAKVVEKGAAASAGVKEGDVINRVNNIHVKSVAELQEQIGRYHPGDKVTIELVRENDTEKLTVELKNRQGSTGIVSSEDVLDALGAEYKEIGKDIKQKLGIDFGLEINKVKEGKLKTAGIRDGYILLKVNDQSISNVEDLRDVVNSSVNNNDKNKVLFIVGVYPNGKITYYAVDMAQ